MATGVAPAASSRPAGLELASGAVPVDAAMRTATAGLRPPATSRSPTTRAAGRPLRVEHWGDALGQGEVAGRTAAGADAVWDAVPGFWSTIGDAGPQVRRVGRRL